MGFRGGLSTRSRSQIRMHPVHPWFINLIDEPEASDDYQEVTDFPQFAKMAITLIGLRVCQATSDL